ncbi:MAG TPA: CBS domain-containing protein, partial [Euryarchaeota archaeon]|nr:CBS domain-containing protein [Euryarchaeota archaeon]
PRYSTLKKIMNALEEIERERVKATIIMTPNVVYANEDEPLLKAITKMIKGAFSQLPVKNSEGKIVGTLDEETVIKSTLNYDPDELQKLKVKDVMKPPLPSVPPDASVRMLITLLSESSAVLVVDRGGNVLGIITRSDLLEYFSDKKQQLGGREGN